MDKVEGLVGRFCRWVALLYGLVSLTKSYNFPYILVSGPYIASHGATLRRHLDEAPFCKGRLEVRWGDSSGCFYVVKGPVPLTIRVPEFCRLAMSAERSERPSLRHSCS